MHFEAHLLYHVYNRGNNGLKLFYKPDHYYFFLGKMRLHLLPHCQLVAHCLMPNHFHFLLQPTLTGAMQNDSASSVRQPLVRGLATLLSSYTQALNPRLQRRGALFQPKTKSKLLAAAPYPLTCFHYIHQNPVRAGLAAELADWPYSSYRDFAGLRNGTLCDQQLAVSLLDLPASRSQFMIDSAQALDPELISGIKF